MDLKTFRRIAGMTQEALAAKAGVDVARLEADPDRATYFEITRLAQAFGVEKDELVSEPQTFAAKLRFYRRLAGFTTQQQFADAADVDVTLISRIETGARRSASYENVVLLARALHLAPEELVTVPLSRETAATAADEATS